MWFGTISIQPFIISVLRKCLSNLYKFEWGDVNDTKRMDR